MKLEKIINILKSPVLNYQVSLVGSYITHDKSRELEKEKVEKAASASDLPISLHFHRYGEVAESISTGVMGGSSFKADVLAALKQAKEKVNQVLAEEIANQEKLLQKEKETKKKDPAIENNISLFCRLTNEIEQTKYLLQYPILCLFSYLETQHRVLQKEISYYSTIENVQGEALYLINEIAILQVQKTLLEKVLSEQSFNTPYPEDSLNQMLKKIEIAERSSFYVKMQTLETQLAQCKDDIDKISEFKKDIRLLTNQVDSLKESNRELDENQKKTITENNFLKKRVEELSKPAPSFSNHGKKKKPTNVNDYWKNENPNHASETGYKKK